jgi:thioredoxin 1
MATPFEVSDATFEVQVLQAAQPTLVDFWAEWCKPCKMIGPEVEALAQECDGRLRVAKLNVDANPDTPRDLHVMSIPTLLLFKNGVEVTRIIGYRPKEALLEALLPHVPLDTEPSV